MSAGRTLEIEGIPTLVHDAGEGPPVVFIHGSGPGVSAWANWRLALPDLARDFRVIAYDQVGFNRTQPSEGIRFGRELWTRHGLALLDVLGVESFDVVGNSMGGAIAFSMASRQPDRVRRIVNMGTMGVPARIPRGLAELWGYTPSEPNMRRAIELLAHDQSINTPELVSLRYQASTAPGIDEAWQAMFPAPRQRWWDDLALSREELARIRQPVLLIHGFEDKVIPIAETSVKLMQILPDVRLHAFGNTGHWVQIERDAEFRRVVRNFLQAA